MSRLRVAGEDEARVIMHCRKHQTRQANLQARALQSHQEAERTESCLMVLTQNQGGETRAKKQNFGLRGKPCSGS